MKKDELKIVKNLLKHHGNISLSELEKKLDEHSHKPSPVKVMDLSALIKTCQEYIDFVYGDNYHDDNDYRQYIYEAALITIYGDKIFDTINAIAK